jgi:hypothetical protein
MMEPHIIVNYILIVFVMVVNHVGFILILFQDKDTKTLFL